MNNKEKKAIIAASNAIDGTTPDGVILMRFKNEGNEGDVTVKVLSYGISGINTILAAIDLLNKVVEHCESIEDQEDTKAFILSELISVFEGKSEWGEVIG